MKEFIDRVSSGKKIIKYENGTTETVIIENAEDATVEGTPINRDNLMAIQGFDAGEIVFNDDGSITKTNANNEKLTMFPVNEKGICKTTISGQKTITKKTTFTPNLILEEL